MAQSLLLQAAAAAALDATRVDLLRLLDLDPTRARLDEHLARPEEDLGPPGTGAATRAAAPGPQRATTDPPATT